jgi:hypothetical protein
MSADRRDTDHEIIHLARELRIDASELRVTCAYLDAMDVYARAGESTDEVISQLERLTVTRR